MILVINLPHAHRSKAQIVDPHGAIRAMVPVTLFVTLSSWLLLVVPGICFAISTVVLSCSHRDCFLGALSAEIAALDLLQQISWLRPTPSVVLDLHSWSTEISGSGLCPSEVSYSHLDLQMSLVPRPTEFLAHYYLLRGPRLVSRLTERSCHMLTSSKVPDSCLHP